MLRSAWEEARSPAERAGDPNSEGPAAALPIMTRVLPSDAHRGVAGGTEASGDFGPWASTPFRAGRASSARARVAGLGYLGGGAARGGCR